MLYFFPPFVYYELAEKKNKYSTNQFN
jgi:hypothetical protein